MTDKKQYNYTQLLFLLKWQYNYEIELVHKYVFMGT